MALGEAKWVAADVAVIGAGVVGLCVARALQVRGLTVIVADPEPPGSQCSYGNAGHIATDQVRPFARLDVLRRVPAMLADRLAPLTVRPADVPCLLPWSLAFLHAALPSGEQAGTRALASLLAQSTQTLLRVIGMADAEALVRRKGALIVHESERSFAKGARDRAIQRENGIRIEEIDGNAAREIAPGLSPGILRATFHPDEWHVADPQALSLKLAEAVVRDGGDLVRQRAIALEVEDAGITGVRTEDGRIGVRAAVVAAGVASMDFLRPLGFRAPIAAERGYHLMVRGGRLGFDLPVSSAERGFIMTPMASGLRLAGTVEFASRSAAPNWERATLLARHAAALVPGLDVAEASRWMGTRPTLPDYLPAVGWDARIRGLGYAFGHHHLGLTLAAVTGEIMAAPVAGEAPAVDPSPFILDRFGRA